MTIPEAADKNSSEVKPSATAAAPTPAAIATAKPRGAGLRWAVRLIVVAVVIFAGFKAVPWLQRAFTTVSTDDAYVNGHVTYTAPRVPGQVLRVLIDDNYRVRKGDLLVELDPEPYQVQVDIAKAAVKAAEADLTAARAEARGIEGEMRSLRFALERSVEDVHNQSALLKAKVATLNAQKATLAKAQADYDRAKPLLKTSAISQEDFDLRTQSIRTAEAFVEEAQQAVFQVRVSLGLPPQPKSADDLAEVPKDLDQNFSLVKQAQAKLIEAAAKIGMDITFQGTPQKMIEDFYKRDPDGNIDRIYEKLLKDAPNIKQAEAKLLQMQRDLEQAELNLRYTRVVAEIDGVVTRRNVNVGNNVVAGQSLMAIRSLKEIWIDANFKETQLRELRIGQTAELEIDMYGSRRSFKGRITGFTMGTGSTLALLPPENATGNFVKVVQRLPVRIELTDYDPEDATLFVGLSVTPYVNVKEPATGPGAGKQLQPYSPSESPISTPVAAPTARTRP